MNGIQSSTISCEDQMQIQVEMSRFTQQSIASERIMTLFIAKLQEKGFGQVNGVITAPQGMGEMSVIDKVQKIWDEAVREGKGPSLRIV